MFGPKYIQKKKRSNCENGDGQAPKKAATGPGLGPGPGPAAHYPLAK